MVDRQPRDNATREKSQRKVSWKPPALLPDPNPHPDWSYRWVRISAYGNVDLGNVSKRFREGYEPVPAAEVPELMVMNDVNADSRFKDNVVTGGMILCRAPKEQVEAREDYYEKMAAQQLESVDNNILREQDPRMPITINRQSQIRDRLKD